MEKANRIAAVGTFDGVHRGHAAVLKKVCETARAEGAEPMAFTLDPHPMAVIAPERCPELICDLQMRKNLLKRNGVNPVTVKFDENLRNLTASQWMKYLHDEYDVQTLVVGYDNTFGSDGVSLSIADYKKTGKEAGIHVIDAPVVDGVSSSAIRKAIKGGNLEKANEMLGRPFTLRGMVVRGNRIGTDLGYPTANLQVPPGHIFPSPGVYAAIAVLPDRREFPAMVNIGRRPTVRRGNNLVIEAHLIGFSGDLYDKPLKLRFIEFIRNEKEFQTIELLRKQIEEDRKVIVQILKKFNGNNKL